jgi:hypothetical protein
MLTYSPKTSIIKPKLRTCIFLKQNITNNVLHTLKGRPILASFVDNN